jgi:hypothetical protein
MIPCAKLHRQPPALLLLCAGEEDMATISKREHREEWLNWAIEFMRRGLWLVDTITVTGPHHPEGHRLGEATVSTDGRDDYLDVTFITVRNSDGMHDVRGMHVVGKSFNDQVTFPLLMQSELSPKALRWLKAAERAQLGYGPKARATCRRALQDCYCATAG